MSKREKERRGKTRRMTDGKEKQYKTVKRVITDLIYSNTHTHTYKYICKHTMTMREIRIFLRYTEK